MRTPTGMLAAAVVLTVAGGALAQQTWVTVGGGQSEALVTDQSGKTWRYTCPPGRSITVVQSGGHGTMTAGTSTGGISSSVVVGGGQASAGTTIGGSGVVVGSPGASQVTVVCR